MKQKSMEIQDNTANSSTNYIYLPFLKNECSENTLSRIQRFREKNPILTETENKTYEFLTYGKKGLSKLPQHSKIYIAGLGINLSSKSLKSSVPVHQSEDKYPYAISGGSKAISIETVVSRMVEDGLLKSNHLIIKLWFADCNNMGLAMAEKFTQCLQDYNSRNIFRIDYYPNCILFPPSTHGGEKHKWAEKPNAREKIRASQVKQSLFFDGTDSASDESSDENLKETLKEKLANLLRIL